MVRTLKQKGVKKLAWFLAGADAEAAVEGAILGDFEPDRHKTSRDTKPLDAFILVAPDSARAAFERGKILAEAQNFTRELVNEPANLMTPPVSPIAPARWPPKSASSAKFWIGSRMRQLGMGSLLGVAQGSAEPPALIIIRYKPARSAQDQRSPRLWSAKA